MDLLNITLPKNKQHNSSYMKVRDLSEKELTGLIKKEPGEVFEWLYNKYAPAFYGVLVQITDNVKAAESLLEDAFVAIWKKMELYNEKHQSLFIWMLNIVKSTGREHLRHSNNMNNASKTKPRLFSGEKKSFGNIQNNMKRNEFTIQLESKHRQVLELICFKGHTAEEAAQILEIPVEIVKTRARHALQTLRRTI